MPELKNDRIFAVESFGLSRREAEVLCNVAEGMTNRKVSSILGITERTVEKHLERVYAKLEVKTRTAASAVLYNLRTGKRLLDESH